MKRTVMNMKKGYAIRRFVPLILALMWCLLPVNEAVVAGQATQAAAITGQVTDETGGVLPGVTVTATSPALQVPQMIAITNAPGEYRLAPLPLGTYTVQYELPGFTVVIRDDVQITAGFTARIDIQLGVGAVQESVTVSGVSPVVDVAATATRTRLTLAVLDAIPTGRSGIVGLLGYPFNRS